MRFPTRTIQESSACICILFLLNYIIWYVGMDGVLLDAVVLLIALFVGSTLLKIIIDEQVHWPVAVLIIALLLISLSSPTVAWDTRSIWLFHAKRIFIDCNIFVQLDGYAEWSHNDYPVIVPALSASLAHAVGYWNEVFPKMANVIFLIPFLCISSAVINNKNATLLFSTGTILICSAQLYDGFMDGVLALCFVSANFLISRFVTEPRDRWSINIADIIIGAILFSIGVLIKNEGFFCFLISISVFSVYLLYKMKYAKVLLLPIVIPILFFLSWKIPCLTHGVVNDMVGGHIVGAVWNKISDFQSIVMILNALDFFYLVIPLFCMIIFSLYNRYHKERSEQIIIISFIALLYICFLIFVYLATPHDLIWHLQTSASRTILPAKMLCLASAVLLFKNFEELDFLQFLSFTRF